MVCYLAAENHKCFCSYVMPLSISVVETHQLFPFLVFVGFFGRLRGRLGGLFGPSLERGVELLLLRRRLDGGFFGDMGLLRHVLDLRPV